MSRYSSRFTKKDVAVKNTVAAGAIGLLVGAFSVNAINSLNPDSADVNLTATRLDGTTYGITFEATESCDITVGLYAATVSATCPLIQTPKR